MSGMWPRDGVVLGLISVYLLLQGCTSRDIPRDLKNLHFFDMNPHFVVGSRNMTDPLCFSLGYNKGRNVQLIVDEEQDLTINAKTFAVPNRVNGIWGPDGGDRMYFSDIAIMAGNCEIIATTNGIKLPGFSTTRSWTKRAQMNCGETKVKIILSGHERMKVLVSDGVRFEVTRHFTKAQGNGFYYLVIYTLKRKGLSEKTHGVIGQFHTMNVHKVEGDISNHGKGGILGWPEGHARFRSNVYAQTRYDPSVQNLIRCWEAHDDAKDLLYGTRHDYLVPKLNYRGMAFRLKKRLKEDPGLSYLELIQQNDDTFVDSNVGLSVPKFEDDV